MTAATELLCETPCPTCSAAGTVDPTDEQVAAYGLLPGTRLRCGSCAGTGWSGALGDVTAPVAS